MKYIYLLLSIFLLTAVTALASSEVDKVNLYWQNGETVLKIDADGPFQFSHQIVEAKDGKPFRVIVDIFPSVHNLDQKSYDKLPNSIIKSIRTSQYSIQPEKTVRVVLDLKHDAVYRIEKKTNSVYVYLPDQKTIDFPAWSSGEKIEGTPKQEIEKSTKLQTAFKPVVDQQPVMTVVPKVDKEKAVPEIKKEDKKPVLTQIQPESTFYQPSQSSLLDQDFAQHQAPVKNTPTAPVENKKSAPPKKPDIKQVEKDMEKPVEQNPDNASRLAKAEPEQSKNYTMLKKPPEVMKPTANQQAGVETKAAPAKTENKTPNVETPKTELAQNDSDKPTKVTNKATSRFRRQPAVPNRLKGTIVAEFPTRMVIKYDPGVGRDPFATLVTDKKGNRNQSFDQKILDIETARLVGILESSTGQYRALVEDIDGFGFILKPGDRIKKGYVTKIYPEKAMFQLFEYGWSRSHVLYLGDDE